MTKTTISFMVGGIDILAAIQSLMAQVASLQSQVDSLTKTIEDIKGE